MGNRGTGNRRRRRKILGNGEQKNRRIGGNGEQGIGEWGMGNREPKNRGMGNRRMGNGERGIGNGESGNGESAPQAKFYRGIGDPANRVGSGRLFEVCSLPLSWLPHAQDTRS